MNIKKIQKNRRKNDGFTIIETLVAITILMISIAGPLTVAHKGLTSALYARDQMIASYLAQDAIEYIKNLRDNNLLKGQAWNDGFSNCVLQGGVTTYCIVDTYGGTPSPGATNNGIQPKNGQNATLYTSSKGYTHYSIDTQKTSFSRYFHLVPSGAAGAGDDESNLIVKVDWVTNNVPNSINVSSSIFNSLR